MIRIPALAAALMGWTAIATPVGAVEVTLNLSLSGDVQRYSARYECEGESEPRVVDYINADPNFLAVMQVEGAERVFASSLSGSGVRYVSGAYVWWTSGAEAMFIDEREGPDAPPTQCIELTEIP